MTLNLNKKLLIGAPILMVCIFAITILLLHFFAPKTDTTSTNTVVALKPSEIITKMKEPGVVSQLLNLYTLQEAAGPTTISYTQEGSYTTYATATDTAEFSQKDTAVSTNSSVVITSIEMFLSTNGLKKVAPTTESSLFTLFDSSTTTCQLVTLPADSGKAATLSVSCIEKSVINNQYSTIDTHLKMYKDQKKSPVNPAAIRISTIKEEDKTLTTLNVYNIDKSAVTLLFAAIGEDWKYIGSQALATDAGDGKTTINRSFSSELETNVQDAKYNGFLKKYVQ